MTVERLPARARRAGAAVACPVCESPADRDQRPFCSRRCREIDLGRWFSGAYAIPAAEPPDGADPEADDPG